MDAKDGIGSRRKPGKMKPRLPGHSKKDTGLFRWSHCPLLPSELAAHVAHCSAPAVAAGALLALALLTPARGAGLLGHTVAGGAFSVKGTGQSWVEETQA